MVYDIVYEQPLYRCYYASSCSSAYIAKLFFTILKIGLPLVVVFSTHGLWKKTGSYREKPKVTFEGRYLIISQSGEDYSFTSTIPVLNTADINHLSVAEVEHYWIGTENEELHIDVRLPINDTYLNTVTFFIIFKYRLDYHSIIEVETAIFDTIYLPSATSSVSLFGRLTADQKKPFSWRESYSLFNYSRKDIEHYKPQEIIRRLTSQGLGLRLERKAEFRLPKFATDSHFLLSFNFLVAEDEFIYKTDFWELIKWAWVQYISIYILINNITNRILDYLYDNAVLEAASLCKHDERK